MRPVETRLFIDGEPVVGAAEATVVHDPSRGSVLARIAGASPDQLADAIASADAAGRRWRRTTPRDRSRLLWAIADKIEENATALAAIEARNTGRPPALIEAGEIAQIADVFRFYATAVRNMPGPAEPGQRGAGAAGLSRHDPLGVVAALLPKSYPLLFAAWKIAPAIAAGNTMVVKPASATPLSLLALAPILNEALPPGVVNVICGPGPSLGRALVADPLVRMVSLTGRPETGQAVLAATTGARPKRMALDLGGRTPVIVLADADLDALVARLRALSFANAGQDCTAPHRIVVDRSIADALAERLARMIDGLGLGATDIAIGPLIDAEHRARVAAQVGATIKAGAQLVRGGQIAPGPGFSYPPTLLVWPDDTGLSAPDIHGPVLSITPVDDIEVTIEALNRAGPSLAASIWSRDGATALRLAHEIDAGTTWVNSHGALTGETAQGGTRGAGHTARLSMQALLDHSRPRHVVFA